LSDWDDDLTLVNHKSKENYQRLIDLQDIRDKSALLEYRVRNMNRKLVVNPKYNIGDYVLAKKKKKDPGSSRKMNPEQSGPYEILDVKLGSAVLRHVKSRKIIDGIPTYLLTKFTPQSYKPNWIQDVDIKFFPDKVIAEDTLTDTSGTNTTYYIVAMNYFGQIIREKWTEDEFLKNNCVYLLNNWRKEKKLLDEQDDEVEMMDVKRRLIQKIKQHKYSFDGLRFLCKVSNSGKKEDVWLTANMIRGKKLLEDYMEKNKLERSLLFAIPEKEQSGKQTVNFN
jgi:hypothetical protein